MLIANFCNGKNKAIVSGAWQYDYGQRLYIHGLELPEVVEIGFSLTETGGMDYPRFAMTKDGVTEVAIPDEMMEGNDVESDYRIYAFVFVEDEKQESGQTVKSIEIRVKSRPKRWMDDETGDNFSEIVKAVRDLVDEYKKSGVSDEQVRAALNDYLADHPIDTLTEDEVRAIVNAMLGDVTQTHFEKVDVLPDEGKENIIYLVPAENTEEQNIYDEYIFLNGIPELIGTTKINLEGYATKEEFRQLSDTVDNKVTNPTSGAVGQILEIESVDANGKPKTYKAVNKPTGGGTTDLTGYATENFVKDYAQPKGNYLESSELPEAINTALAQAKESGEFDGEDGITPHIGENGKWFIGNIDTGVKAQGGTGLTGATGYGIFVIKSYIPNDGGSTQEVYLSDITIPSGYSLKVHDFLLWVRAEKMLQVTSIGENTAMCNILFSLKGSDGKTPVKGTDYFTEADKQAFVTDVLNALPTWTGGSY